MRTAGDTEYRRVQGLSRGLSLLHAMNRTLGGRVSVRQLSEQTGLHRTTVRRLLETLQADGYVSRSPSDDRYGLTLQVRALSEGFTDQEWVSSLAAPVMGELLKEVQWPSDLTTLDGSSMLIRESTHRFSRLSFARSMVGQRMPLIFTASGRAYLAACPARELKELTRLMVTDGGAQAACAGQPALLKRTVERVRQAGYATNEGDWHKDSPTWVIALPIVHGDKVLGCLNLVYLRRAMSLQQAADAYLPALRSAVSAIETGVAGAARPNRDAAAVAGGAAPLV